MFNKPYRFLAVVLSLCVVGAADFYYMANLARRHAEEIFAREMLKQQVLQGSVTAQKVDADLQGNVYLDNLSWLDTKGEPVVFVPRVRLKVSLFDAVTGSFGKDSIKELELTGPRVMVAFNEKMQPELAQLPPPPQKGQHPDGSEIKSKSKLNLAGKLPRMQLLIHDAELLAVQKKRIFALHDVDIQLAVLNDNELQLKLVSGPFGGVMQGAGLRLEGKVRLDGKPGTDMHLALEEVVPKSLGLGNIEDPVTITGQVTGTPVDPLIDGVISFEELHLPALLFNKVAGNFHYENGMVTLSDVTAGLYGGNVDASGWYNFDTRDYAVDAKGHELIASLAARDPKVRCSVELELHMRGYGATRDVHTYGKFTSGGGSIYLVPFHEISGKFSNRKKHLQFRDVEVRTNFGTFVSDAFSIDNGKVHIDGLFMQENKNHRYRLM